MKIDKNRLQKLVDQKYVNVQKHPDVDLFIYNYGQKAQYEKAWDDLTMMCRGLILDSRGEIVSRAFNKFFNLEEHIEESSKLPPLPIEPFEVTEKLDGSLGIMYWIGDQPYIATRGSFVSDQAIKANQILKVKYSHIKFNPNYTYLTEIIYPDNRIVIDYGGMEDLILLAVIHTESGEEVDHRDYKDVLPIVKTYEGIANISKLKDLQEDNKEGFVVRFRSGVRVKVKFEEYVRLHRLVTGVNKKTIWELLKNDQPFDELLERVPDEFYAFVKDTKAGLEGKFKEIEGEAKYALDQIKDMETRKEQALFLKEYSKYPSVVFALLDKQLDRVKDNIWKMIRPVAEKPYKTDIDA